MSEKPRRSPRGDWSNTSKKKKRSPAQPMDLESTSESDSQEKHATPAKRTLFIGSDSAGTSRSRDAMNDYFRYAFGTTYSESDTLSKRSLPILKEAEGENYGLHSAPLPFASYFSPRKTPVKTKLKKVSRNVRSSIDSDTDDPPKSQSSEDDLPARRYVRNLSDISPSQRSTNAFLEVQKERYEKRFDLPGCSKDQLFPNNPFPEEEKESFKTRNLFVGKDVIDEFISPMETSANRDVPEEFIVTRATKPYNYDYTEDKIIKKDVVYMKRRVTKYFREVEAVLLTSGGLLFYKTNRTYPEPPIFSYPFQDYLIIEDDNHYLIETILRDSVYFVDFLLDFASDDARSEWEEVFQNAKNSSQSPEKLSDFEFEENRRRIEFDAFCNKYDSLDSSVECFELLLILGRGAYGTILACKDPVTNRQRAMKVMRKDIIIKQEGIDSVIYENYVLRLYHPFLQKLSDTLVTENLVIFIMDFANGGSLHDYVFNKNMFSEKIAVYYGAQMISAIIYLHSMKMVFRDLNLSNCYLDYEGNLKITDFGFCIRDSDQKAYNPHIMQDPCYVAPELLSGEPYAFSCDWWSFGVCFFRMLTGVKLFNAASTIKIADQTINESLNFYSENKFINKDFVSRILENDPRKRLGCSSPDTEREVLEHSIFTELLWKKSKGFEIQPPIRPLVAGDDDYSSLKDHSAVYENALMTHRTPGSYIRHNGKLIDIGYESIEWENPQLLKS